MRDNTRPHPPALFSEDRTSVFTKLRRRAGLVWNVDPQPRFAVMRQPEGQRWGLFHFTFPRPVRTGADLQEVFGHILPVLRQLYTRFHPEGGGS
jgi:hypothetical protein